MKPFAGGRDSEKGKGRKVLSREARFKKIKAAEAAARTSHAKRNDGNGATSLHKGKAKAKKSNDDVEEDPHPFRYKSFNDRLASVHINVATNLGRSGTGALAGLDGHGLATIASTSLRKKDGSDDESEEDASIDGEADLHAKTSFGIALQTWKELNLSLPFTSLVQRIQPLSLSLPLLLHNQEKIAKLLHDTLSDTYPDSYLAYEPALDLIPRLANDLGSAFLPSYVQLLSAILRTTTIDKLSTEGQEYTAAMIVERSFESMAATLRCMAPFVLRETQSKESESTDWLEITWHLVRPYLGYQKSRNSHYGIDAESVQVDEELAPLQAPIARRKKIPTHTRRFVSEALAHLVRRAKSNQLHRVAKVMMEDVIQAMDIGSDQSNTKQSATRGFVSGVAGIWAEVAKSVEGRIHSMAPAHLQAALQVNVTIPPFENDSTTFRARTLVGVYLITSLCHHAQAAELVPIFSWLSQSLEHGLNRMESSKNEGSERVAAIQNVHQVAEWMTAYIGTRKGKRVNDDVKSDIFRELLRLAKSSAALNTDDASEAALVASSVQLISVALPIARIQDLIGNGLKIIEALELPSKDLYVPLPYSAVVISLASLEFSGYQQVVIPSVLRVTSSLLEFKEMPGSKPTTHCCDAIQLLSFIDRQGILDTVIRQPPTAIITRWQSQLANAVERAISEVIKVVSSSSFNPNLLSSRQIACISLAGLVPIGKAFSTIDGLCALICSLAKTNLKNEEGDKMNISSNSLISLALYSLTRVAKQHGGKVTVHAIACLSQKCSLEKLLLERSYHRSVVIRTAQFAHLAKEQGASINFSEASGLVAALESNAASADETLRLSSLQILSLASFDEGNTSQPSIFVELAEVEEKGLTVESVRERNVLLRSIGRNLVRLQVTMAEGTKPSWFTSSSVKFVIRVIVSTMKLNLRPLWEEARKTLIDLSAQFGQDVWAVAFEELSEASLSSNRHSHENLEHQNDSIWTAMNDVLGGFDETIDRQFQDPQLASRRNFVFSALQEISGERSVEKHLMDDEALHGRLDSINYQVQILALFTSIASVAERNNAPLINHFFRTIVDRPDTEVGEDEHLVGVEDDDDEDGDDAVQQDETKDDHEPIVLLSRNQRRDQLCAYLETFAQFSNPKALYRSADVYAYLHKLCAQGDSKIQRLALNAILRWKDPAHMANADLLKNLLDPSQFREQLTAVVLANTSESTIQPGHRAGLLPVLLRLMYGLIVSKSSRMSGQANRRSAILTTLADLEPQDLRPFIDVMLEPFNDICGNVDKTAFILSDKAPLASQRVQSGFIALLEDVLKYLGLRIIPFWPELIGVLLNITHHASIAAVNKGPGKKSQIERNVRQSGLRRLNEFFRQPTNAFNWQFFLPVIFQHLISPRLPAMRNESIQSPSAVLEIIHTWSSKRSLVFNLTQYDSSLLQNTTSCLQVHGVKPTVIIRILDVIDNILTHGEEEDDDDEKEIDEGEVSALSVKQHILQPHVSTILNGIESSIRRCESATPTEAKALGRDEMLRRMLSLLSRMASYVTKPEDISSLFSLLGPLLRKSNAIISEKSKADVLIVLEKLMPQWLIDQRATRDNVYALYSIFSALFSKLRGRVSRSTLVRAFSQFGEYDPSLAQVIDWTTKLNAFDEKRMQEYDFDSRLGAYDAINAESPSGSQIRTMLSPLHWSPLLHNFIYFIQDPDELAIRASSGTAIRRFIDTYQSHLERGQVDDTDAQQKILNDLQSLFTGVVFLGLRRSLRAQSDLVRREAVETIGYAVAHLSPHLSHLNEMKGLLFEGDEEANFFNNIEHIQVHRRLRALTRLGQEALSGHIKSRTILDVFMPLVEHFLLTEHNHGDGNLIQKAVEVLGQLSSQLKWGPYNVLLWKYLSHQNSKSDKGGKEDESKSSDKITEKVAVRAAMCILDNFHFDMDEDMLEGNQDLKDGDAPQDDEDEEVLERDIGQGIERSEKLAQSRKVLDAVRNRLLPRLIECLDLKDEMEDTVRLPIAIGVARIVLLLPLQYRRTEAIRMLNRMSHVFRSKAQDTRDLARSTLAKVAVILGPTYFRDIVIELRKVLTRGPQIAVLAFTLHNILLHCVDNADQRLSILEEHTTGDVIEVIIEDVFGRTAEDRQSIENRTTYKEVKSTKSLDTLEQVARIVSPSAIRAILVPVKELMSQTEAAQATRNFDDYLRRAAVGLQANSHLDAHAYLVLCHELVNASSESLFKKASSGTKRSKQMRRTSAVLSKRSDVEKDAEIRNHFGNNAHRFVAFGLDLLSSALRKGRFDFNNASTLSMLEPLLGAVGNSLYANQTSIIVQGVRSLTLLVRCPLQTMKNVLPTIVKQTMKLVQREGNTRSDTLMACLKLLTVLVRDVGQKENDDSSHLLTEQQLTTLCHLIEMHVEEDVEMQGTLFSLLRALILRKLTVPELYDLMDKVARMLVVQQSESVRSTCRATFLDFLLNLPQGKKRFANQIHFLVQNLEYVYESGRSSVLDFLRSMLDKISDEVLRPYLDLMFVALVMRLANDESSACREKAALLIRKIVDVSGQAELGKLIALTQSWSQSTLDNETGRNLSRVSMLVFGIMLDAEIEVDREDSNAKDWEKKALSQSIQALKQCASYLEEREIDVEQESWMEEDDDLLSDWQIPYQSLQLITRIFKQRKEIWSDRENGDLEFRSVWPIVARLLLFPHAWVRSACCRLIGEHFGTQTAKAPKRQDELTDMVDLSKKMTLVLRSPQIDEQLSTQVIKNLVFIAKCFVDVDSESITQSSGNGLAEEEEDEIESEMEDEDVGQPNKPKPVNKTNHDEDDALWHKQPLRWLFNRLSHQLRRSGADRVHISQGAMLASSAILKWMAAIMSQLDIEMSKRYLVHVVAPIYRILESNITIPNMSDANGRKPSKMGDIAAAERRSSLENLAREVQELLQAKVGTQLFAFTYATVKRKANDKRHQRRAQAIQRGIDFPEQMAARKSQRNVRKHESRKRKNDSYAKGKERVRPSKRQR